MHFRKFLLILILITPVKIIFAQDVTFYLTGQYLHGKPIAKLSRDFDDPYMWVLGKSNDIYRVNTLNNQVEDLTAAFQQFSGKKIFDIAGIDQNLVVLAVRDVDSVKLVTYNNGAFQYISQNVFYTVQGTIQSIGASSAYTEKVYGVVDRPVILIATDKGFYRYSLQSNVLNNASYNRSEIYAATYRTQVIRNYVEADTAGTNLVPVMGTSPEGLNNPFRGVMREGPPFGDTINTAFFTINQVSRTPAYFTPDLFWGNSNGLWQTKINAFHPYLSSYRHYLDGIQVNKVCDIFGLTTLGNQAAKENLLVGTDNGLYYSNSVLKSQADTTLDNVTLYHFDPLGNIPINFVEVNHTGASFPPPFCEDGVWIATNNGIYLLKPDYASHVNQGQLVNAIHFINQDSVSTAQICAGDTIRAQLNYDVTTTSLQWFKDGAAIASQSRDTLAISAAGNYYAVLYDPCSGVHLETNHLTVQTIAGPVFSFNYPNKLQYCDSTATTLKTTYNPIYHYRWYTNGVLNGDTTYTYIVTQSGKYKVEVSACTNSWVPSKEIEVDLVNLPIPIITADKAKYCADDTAKLTANVPTDPAYTINWYKDGNLIASAKDQTIIPITGNGNYSVIVSSTIANCTKTSNTETVTFTPAPLFTFNYPDKLQYCAGTPVALAVTGSSSYHYRWYKDGTLNRDTLTTENITQSGKYKVEVSSCEGSWIPSKEVEVDLISIPIPVIKTDKAAYCIGDNATLSLNVQADPTYTINWYKNNVLLAVNANQTTITTDQNGNYSVVVSSNATNTDGTTCSQSSSVKTVQFNSIPTVSIQKIIKTTLCDGQTVDLRVIYDSGTVKWTTGQSSDQITISSSGTYTATVTTPSGCSKDTSIDVQFFPNPILNLPNAGVCVPSHKTATITAPAGMASYTWNGQRGTETYVADHPQTVSLTITDQNGCQATQNIEVTDECPNISIPNAFTPNGDGVNDTWNIIGLEYDPTSTVKIFTRYGQQVYESKGYNRPWDGNSGGKQLPAGVYYYIIKAKNDSQTYSGSVTIIY